MYEDLITILRAKAGWVDPVDEELLTQAADAIEELQAELNHIHEIMSMWKLPEPPKEDNNEL